MIQVAGIGTFDALSGIGSGLFTLNVTSSEPSDPTNPDVVIMRYGSQKIAVQLRADRLDNGTGRIYTLTAVAQDMAGNSATTTATCVVPHDQGK